MSQPPQQFCVRWNSYHTNLQTVFPKLLTTENFVDVTLACENRQIKCHKVVLSACSTYFERLLIQNPCKHPIIFMKDMRFSEMQSLVDFMYKGEVNVSQDDLPSLLKSAEALQIRGLCGSESAGGGSSSQDTPVAPSPQIAIPLLTNHATTDTSPRDSAEGNVNNNSAKPNPPPPPSPNASSNASSSPLSNGQAKRRRDGDGESSPEAGKTRRVDSLKQETVEEDGLYYGDIDLGEIECNDQGEEDILQTGTVSGQPSAGTKTPSIRVKSRSELCNNKVEKSLINRLQLCPQISFKTYHRDGPEDCSKIAKELKTEGMCNFMPDLPKMKNTGIDNISQSVQINNLSCKMFNPSCKDNTRGLKDRQPVTSAETDVNSFKEEDEQMYEDEEYLKMWLLQNQELEVSLSNGGVIFKGEHNQSEKNQKAAKTPVKKYEKKTDPSEQKWLQYYTTPQKKEGNNLDYCFGKKPDKGVKKKAKQADECLNLLDFLDPSDLDQFLAGKEVSSSGVSRNAIEQAMLGKYNPNRRYSNQAMWAALMDVKQGGSIYRAAQTHKVPRKSLRNWMKRWHIKSSFPMPQQLKQFVENNRKHKTELRRELTSTLLSLGARNKITNASVGQYMDESKAIKREDLLDSDAFNHFMDMSHGYFGAGDIREMSSGEDNDENKEISKTSDIPGKDEFLNDGGCPQIMDMSGNILFDESVVGNHEESQNDENAFKDNESDAVIPPQKYAEANVTVVKKISFSNVEQLAGLDNDTNSNEIHNV